MVVLWRNPDRVVSADVLFIVKDRLSARESKEGYIETIPDLVAEVRSKNDSLAEVEQKTQEYLKAGVRILWVIDNDERTVTISRAEGVAQVLGENDMLRADGVIPDFAAAVVSLFAS
jgi:Uma2 family endonuclease